jgi:heptose-I-phosphate ethanolaminephosphotransferase
MDDEKWSSCPIFPAIFKKAGFNVYFWDNQKTSNTDVSDFSIFSYLYDKKISKLSYTQCNTEIYTYDMDFVKSFFKLKINRWKKNLIIFHLIGQHCPAQTKYPLIPMYLHFTSDSISGSFTEIQKQQIAHYDNAIRYNDDVMHYLISQVEDKECIIVYLSDHGEEVHDYRNLYGRSHESIKTPNILKYQYEIPFMIWCSDKYKEKHSMKIENIKIALGKPFMNDNTCQILFDIADIHSNYNKQDRNLISTSYNPNPYRRVQNSVVYEDVIKDSIKNRFEE